MKCRLPGINPFAVLFTSVVMATAPELRSNNFFFFERIREEHTIWWGRKLIPGIQPKERTFKLHDFLFTFSEGTRPLEGTPSFSSKLIPLIFKFYMIHKLSLGKICFFLFEYKHLATKYIAFIDYYVHINYLIRNVKISEENYRLNVVKAKCNHVSI